jgi:hypothetical protein
MPDPQAVGDLQRLMQGMQTAPTPPMPDPQAVEALKQRIGQMQAAPSWLNTGQPQSYLQMGPAMGQIMGGIGALAGRGMLPLGQFGRGWGWGPMYRGGLNWSPTPTATMGGAYQDESGQWIPGSRIYT